MGQTRSRQENPQWLPGKEDRLVCGVCDVAVQNLVILDAEFTRGRVGAWRPGGRVPSGLSPGGQCCGRPDPVPVLSGGQVWTAGVRRRLEARL